MRFVGNLLWFVVFGGWAGGLVLVLLGCVCMITIVGIPFGIACFRISRFAFFPFGKALVSVEEVGGERQGGDVVNEFPVVRFLRFLAFVFCCYCGIGVLFHDNWDSVRYRMV